MQKILSRLLCLALTLALLLTLLPPTAVRAAETETEPVEATAENQAPETTEAPTEAAPVEETEAAAETQAPETTEALTEAALVENTDAAADTAQTQFLDVLWNEEGTDKYWSYGNETPEFPLPSGVSYTLDEQTLTVTLNNASLTGMYFMNWGDIAVRLVVEGTNTIHHSGRGSALGIYCCPNVTISGSGTLNLLAENETFCWHDYIFEPESEGPTKENPDGTLTISGVTLNATSDHLNWSADWERRDYDYLPMRFRGGSVWINGGAAIHAEGASSVEVLTKMTIDGASLTAPGLSVNPRDGVVSENREDFMNSLTLTSGSISLRYPDYCKFGYHLLHVGPNGRLNINGGTLTLDNSGYDVKRTALGMWYETFDETWVTPQISITGGTVDVKMGKLDDVGITVPNGSKYVQSGGDVTVSVPYGNGVTVIDSEFHLSGGTMRIIGTENDPAIVPPEDRRKTGLYINDKASVVVSSTAGLYCSGNLEGGIQNSGDMTISGGTVDSDCLFQLGSPNADSVSLEISGGTVTAPELQIGLSTVDMLGGSLATGRLFIHKAANVDILGGSLTAEHLDIFDDSIVKFSGGETQITDSINIAGDPKTSLVYGEGIRAVDANGAEMILVSSEDNSRWHTDGPFPITIQHFHTEETIPGKAATCTETGLTEGKRCSVCGEILVKQETVSKKAHTEVVDQGKAATCTEKGLTEGKRCSVCGEILTAQKEIPAKGHTEVVDQGKAATCTEKGLTEGKHCSVCNTVLTAQKEIPAKGHTEVIDPAKEPTATETGLTEGKHCSVCNTVLVKQEVIPAKGTEPEKPPVSTVPMYRLYNPFTQEHLLSGDEKEKDALVSVGWKLDGVAWQAPTEGEPVYRLYNPFDDWHTYSRSQEEIDSLTDLGWTVDGAVTFSAPAEDGMIIYRLFNPYVQTNYHLLTASDAEKDMLIAAGWKMDGGAWYAAKP